MPRKISEKITPKKVMQDIVPSQRRSIRAISKERSDYVINDRAQEKAQEKIQERAQERAHERDREAFVMPKKQTKKKKGRKNTVIIFIIIFASIALIAAALSLLYSRAVVNITLKADHFTLDDSKFFTAKKEPLSDELGYEVITTTDELHQSIPATKGPLIESKAKGTVVIYNNYSATAQKLLAGTRISNPDGLIYRTTTSVIVPGKKATPGSISVGVVADQAGSNYNQKVADLAGDFKIVGYKDTPKYAGFYGRIKTDIVGGFSGTKMIVSPDTQKATTLALEASLKESLVSKLKASVPDGYIFYDNAYSVDYTPAEPTMEQASSSVSGARISVKGTGYGIIFKSDTLIKFIAGKELQKFPSSTYTITGEKDLVFKIINTKDLSIKKGGPVIFSLKGPISIVGTFSEKQLKDELKGVSLSSSNLIFAKYPAIANAYALITPFWMRSFPNSANTITFVYKTP